MKRSDIGFPHPVLCSENNDYIDSSFSLIALESPLIEDNIIHVKLSYFLDSQGLTDMIKANKAKVILFCECAFSSFRQIYSFEPDMVEKELSIDATGLSRNLRVKAMIIASANIKNFHLKEHNSELFENFGFTVHKGDIMAISNIFDIELGSVDPLANRPSVFSIRPDDTANDTIRVDLLEDLDKINIWLKRDIHQQYQDLHGEPAIRTLLASYFVLPALVEALEFMRNGAEDDVEMAKEKGWYQSISVRLGSLGINLEDETSMTTVANKILLDIILDAMKSLKDIKDNILTGNTEG